MSKSTVITKEDYSNILIKRQSGVSLKAIAEDYDCSAETVRKAAIKAEASLPKVPTGGPIFFNADPLTKRINSSVKVVHIQGDFIVDSIVVTGDEKDGTLICSDVFSLAEMNSKPEDCLFDEGDFGSEHEYIIGKLIVAECGYVSDILSGSEYTLKTDRIAPDLPIVIELKSAAEKATEAAQECMDTVAKQTAAYIETDPLSVEAEEFDKANRPKTELIWNASKKFISITEGRKAFTADSDHPGFKTALQALVDGDVERALEIINVERQVTRFVKGNVVIENGTLYYKGVALTSGIARRVLDTMHAGGDFEFYLPFLENVMLNPSRRVVTRIFDFLKANDIEITKDGHFLAWKYVNENYTDCASGKFDNSPGKTVEMPRNECDDDDSVTCSTGLHVCAKSYFSSYSGARFVQVKVNPENVVSVPIDYNDAKMRTCKYEVLKDVSYMFKNR